MPQRDLTLAPAFARSASYAPEVKAGSSSSFAVITATEGLSAGTFISALVRVLDARVDDGIQHVDHEIHHDHRERAEENEILDDRVIAPANRIDEIASE